MTVYAYYSAKCHKHLTRCILGDDRGAHVQVYPDGRVGTSCSTDPDRARSAWDDEVFLGEYDDYGRTVPAREIPFVESYWMGDAENVSLNIGDKKSILSFSPTKD